MVLLHHQKTHRHLIQDLKDRLRSEMKLHQQTRKLRVKEFVGGRGWGTMRLGMRLERFLLVPWKLIDQVDIGDNSLSRLRY